MTSARVEPFVDGMAVLLHLLRTGLPPMRTGLSAVTVFEDMPDGASEYMPLVRIARTGGSSDRPRFHAGFLVNVQVWSDREAGPGWDPHQAAYQLSQQVATVLFTARESQVSTPYGSIAKWRESSGFRKFTDPELPFIGRYVATYDLLVRNPH